MTIANDTMWNFQIKMVEAKFTWPKSIVNKEKQEKLLVVLKKWTRQINETDADE